jgi:lipopolysaccharide transport system ATP-binding protein
MSSEARAPAVRASGLAKHYRLYDKPHHRLLQTLYGERRHFFREFRALDDVSFELPRGETLGVIGRNGAGKSTLLGLICGTIRPTLGTIEVQGRVAALLELGTGFNPEFTGRQNVLINAAILGLSGRQIQERLDDILSFADIGAFVDQPVKTYSSGMYVRLAFSVIVHVRPDILIVDEALAVGDALFQAKCMTRMRRMLDDGMTLLFTSHDINAVKALCRRAMWLEGGRVREFGDTSSVASAYFYVWVRQANALQGMSDQQDAVAQARSQVDLVSILDTDPLAAPDAPAVASSEEDIPLQGAGPSILVKHLGRSGTGTVRLQRMGWCTEGRPASQAHACYGDTLSIWADISIHGSCSRLVVSFHIKDRHAQYVFGGHTADRPEIFEQAWSAGQGARLQFQVPVLLHEGAYTLTMLVTSIGDKTRYVDAVFHDWVEDVATLTVAPRQAFPLSDLVEVTPQVTLSLLPQSPAIPEDGA